MMSYRLFIDPLPLSFTSADLSALVRPFGTVVSANVVRDSLGISLRFGYVKMEAAEAADNVCKHLHRTVLDGERHTVLRLNGMETHEDQDTLTGPT
jgi:RNA recognition motif-containing protein